MAFCVLFSFSRITMTVVGKYKFYHCYNSKKWKRNLILYKSKVKLKVKLSVNITIDYVTIQVYLFVHLREICNIYPDIPESVTFTCSPIDYKTTYRSRQLSWICGNLAYVSLAIKIGTRFSEIKFSKISLGSQ